MQAKQTILSALKRFCLIAVLLALTPLIWLIMILDYPHLRRAAFEVNPEDKIQRSKVGNIVWIVVREILCFIFLPIISIVGMFLVVCVDDGDVT